MNVHLLPALQRCVFMRLYVYHALRARLVLGKVAMQTLLLNYYNILLIQNTVNDFFCVYAGHYKVN